MPDGLPLGKDATETLHGSRPDVLELERAENAVRACTDTVGAVCALRTHHGGGLTLLLEAGPGLEERDWATCTRAAVRTMVAECGLAPETVGLVRAGALAAPAGGEPANASARRREVLRRYRSGELELLHRHDAVDPARPSGSSSTGTTGTTGTTDVGDAAGRPVPAGAPAPRSGGLPALTLESMREDVARSVGVTPSAIGDEDDLVYHGLDSIRLMQLVNQWQLDSLSLKFADFAERPVLAAWWKLVTDRRERPAGGEAGRPADGSAVDESEPFALTPVQHAYWIGRRDDQVLGGVACHFYVEFDGDPRAPVDPGLLEGSVRELMRRHAMLRARFLDDGTQQVPEDPAWPGLTVHDLRGAGEAEVERHLAEERERLAHRRLDVDGGVVFDVRLSLLPGDRHRMHVNVDLLVADVLSIQILFRDLSRIYRAGGDADRAGLPELGYGFPTYLARVEDRRSADRERAREYWHARLPDLPGGPQLPVSVEPSSIAAPRFVRRDHRLDARERAALEELARRHGVTVPVLLATAYAEVLGAWSTEPRFLLNVPLFDRSVLDPHVEHLVADFTNLVPLEVDLDSETGFGQRALELQARLRSDMAHSEYTGVEVLRDLARSRTDGAPPPSVVFTSAVGMGDLVGQETQEAFGRLGWMLSQTPQVWLDHQVIEQDGGLLLVWDAVEELFPPGVLDAMFTTYTRLLDHLGDHDWNTPLPPLLPPEQRLVRATANDTTGPLPDTLLHDGFFTHAARTPHRTALLTPDGHTTYHDLADQALRIATTLLDRGTTPGEPIAVTLPKGPDQIAAVLGILAAGAAYVPVGVDQPPERRKRIYQRAGVRTVLTGETADEQPGEPATVPLADCAASAPLDAPLPQDPDTLAYVIFTSGSTGEPKGVAVSHRAAMNTITDLNDRCHVTADDRVLALSALDFDLSVYDTFGLLTAGGTLILPHHDHRTDPDHWHHLAHTHHPTIWNTVPALLDMLLTTTTDDHPLPPTLRLALVSGDWIPLDLHPRLTHHLPHCTLIALGGATEAGIWSNHHHITTIPPHWTSIPYGRPLRNQHYRVVNHHGHDAPDWVPGELWIGGHSLALGYHNDPHTTDRKFPHTHHTRWYRTGDLGRYWPDGTLEFLGRTDHQIKINGHRIELGEIETALTQHPHITTATALKTPHTHQLAAAVTPAGTDDPPSEEELLAHLSDWLPPYAVPVHCVFLDAMPLTPNGKIDRRTVADLVERALEDIRRGTSAQPPRGPAEEAVAAVWEELLNVSGIHRDDNFFSLGGDSLIATRVVSRLRAAGWEGAELGDLFKTPELAAFSTGLRSRGSAAGPAVPVLRPAPEHRYEPFDPTDVQRAYWMGRTDDFELGGVGCHFYTEYDGEHIDLHRLEDAWNTLIARHDMLRAVFLPDGRQQVRPEVPPFTIPVSEAGPDPEEAEAALAELRSKMSHQVLDPCRWPLFDVRAVRYGRGRVRLGVSFDSILIDALSVMTLLRELDTLYHAPDAELPPVEVTFRDYVTSVRPSPEELESSEAYWSERVLELPDGPQLPLAKDPSAVGTPRFVRREDRLPAERWQRLRERARACGVTGSTLLVTAFSEVLSNWSARQELTVNLTLFDRREAHPHIGRVLGDFTSLLLLGYRPEADETWRDALLRTQRQMGRDLAHSDVSALWVMRELARRRGAHGVTMPVVFTSTLGVFDGDGNPGEPSFAERVWGVSQTPQVWLDHQVIEQDGGLLLVWDAVEELFPPGVLDAMFTTYTRLLDHLGDHDWNTPLPPLLPPEQRLVRATANDTTGPLPDTLLHDGFFTHAARTPHRTALLTPDGHTTYHDLADQALRIATTLLDRGTTPGEPIAVTLPKGPDQIAAVLGILAAGAAYVPVGVDQPPERRKRIYQRAGVRTVLTGETADEQPGEPATVPLADCAASAPLDAPLPQDPDTLAYVIFTSGSTGEPKGVAVSHRAAMNTITDLNDRCHVTADDRVLALSALDFDLSVYDTFGLLTAGGTLILPHHDHRTDPDHWHHLAHTHHPTIWNTVPALLDMLLTTTTDDHPLPPTLRLALVSGDWIPLDLHPRLTHHLPHCTLIALGGATEAGIWSNHHHITTIPPHWTSIPYGRPLRNQHYRVVNHHGHDAPDWVPGELWIGGHSLALGYHNDPHTTDRKFPHTHHTRWYRTGDLGRYWPDGTLEFLGRTDHQIKINGHRIELGEIETALTQHPHITTATALKTPHTHQLAAAVTPDPEAAGDDSVLEDLEDFLAQRLPSYAIPQVCLVLDAMPLTPNGKIDRRTVADLFSEERSGGGSQPPRGPAEEAVAAVWEELLNVSGIHRDDNFFSLGGDSLIATRMAQALRERHGVEVTLRQLFSAPTVAETAALIDSFEEGSL